MFIKVKNTDSGLDTRINIHKIFKFDPYGENEETKCIIYLEGYTIHVAESPEQIHEKIKMALAIF